MIRIASAPIAASAKVKIDIGIGISLPGIIIGIDDHGFMRHANGRIYVSTPRVCGISAIKVQVTGDSLRMRDFDILFGNGETQDIPMREMFRKNSESVWKDVNGQERCIVGFSVKADSDLDFRNARVTLIGLQRWGWASHQVNLGSALIRDFQF